MSESTTAGSEAPVDDYGAVLANMRAADEAPEIEADEAPEAPEPAQEETPAEPDDAQDKRRRGLVAELQDERKARRELREELERERAERRKGVELLQRLMERQAAPQQPAEPEMPSLEADPVGHFKAKTEMLERQLQAVQQPLQQQSAEAQLAAVVAQAERAYVAETPDYFDATKFLSASLAAEEQAMGLMPGTLARNVAATALQNGKNPAEVAYKMAKARGYAKAAPANAPDPIDTLEAGAKAARGVASVAGNAPPSGLTLEAINRWSQDEFARHYANPKMKAAIIRAMGGEG